MMKLRTLHDISRLTQGLTLFCSLCLACPVSKAASRIQFGDIPVELTVSQVSERTVRLALSPLDAGGKPMSEAPAPGFVPFSTTEKLRVRELAGERDVRVGQLHVTITPQPLVITVSRADGTLVQKLTFDGEDGMNFITFPMAAPLLGLGEGGPQFDRREHFYPTQNGEGSPTLATDGARILVPYLIGTEGVGVVLVRTPGRVSVAR